MLSERQEQLADGLMLAGADVNTSHVSIQLTGKDDAEWLYREIEPLANERELSQTGDRYLGREFYLELVESPLHELNDEDDFEWNHTTVWEVNFVPTGATLQYLARWYKTNRLPEIPDGFALMPLVGKVLYKVRAFEMYGDEELFIEFESYQFNENLQSYFERLGINVEQVQDLYRIPADDAQVFREHIGVKHPRPNVKKDDYGGDAGDI